MNKGIYNCTKFDINVITLDNVFDKVQVEFINNINNFTYQKNYIEFNSEVKRYFLHTIIKVLSEYLYDNKVKNKIVLIQPSFADYDYELWKFIDKDIIIKYVLKLFKQIKNDFPIPIYITDNSVDLNSTSGEVDEVLNILSEIVNNFKSKVINTKKLRKYSEKNGLLYLTNIYFVSGKFKKLLFNS
jgi:hypothetical protein